MNNTKKLIYEMLTECTGVHMCDSGMSNNRHWQELTLIVKIGTLKQMMIIIFMAYLKKHGNI